MRAWRPSLALIVMLGLTFLGMPSARGQELPPIDPKQVVIPAEMALRLEVFVNGVSTHLVEPFTLTSDNHLLVARGDLEEIGIKPGSTGDPHARIDVAGLPGVSAHYDVQHQSVDFILDDADRLPRLYDAHSGVQRAPPASADWGTVLNYTVTGTTTASLEQYPRFQGVNAALDGRAFGPYGVVTQTGIVGDTLSSNHPFVRLDSTYEYSDQDRMLTGRVGDVISGGLVWSRPIRLGGLQLQRNFGLRSDLVTQPMPMISGSAAVPSTVDVFVNNVKTFSQNVSTGPYNIANLPTTGSNGTANVVVTDATGRQTQMLLPFYSTPTLLAPGLVDFDVDAGFARRNYGTLSDDYDRRPLGAFTARYGLTDWLTTEAHAEGGAGLVNGGLGAAVRAGQFGILSFAAAGSHAGGQTGAQFYADYNLLWDNFSLDVSTQRTVSHYNDLASVTATRASAVNFSLFTADTFDPHPPVALDRVTVSTTLGFDPTQVSASLINVVQADGTHSRIVSGSLSRSLPHDATIFATGFTDLDHHEDFGVYVGLSMQLTPKIQASVGGSLDGSGRQGTFDVSQNLDHSDGSYGWRLRDNEGESPIRIGDASYRSAYGTASVEVTQQEKSIGGQAAVDGSVGYVSNGGPFVANHVQDGFVVVNTGIAGVPVYQDNRLVGKTGPWGQYVLPDIPSYQSNQIGIDPLSLPMNAEASSTKQAVSAARNSGLAVTFGVDRHIDAALVTFHDASGTAIVPGSRGHVGGDGEAFIVGYDGQAYVKHLKADNTVSIDLGDRDCTAKFAYQPKPGERPLIGPVICQ